MPELKHNVSGVWKKTRKVYIKVGGAWKVVRKVYVKVNGAWKLTQQNSVRFDLCITGTTYNFDLRTALINNGWDGATPVVAYVTIYSGVQVLASNTNINAFNIDGYFPPESILTVTNNGWIVGRGGTGAVAGAWYAGGAGGGAFSTTVPVTINNHGVIGGGGGGGGAGASFANYAAPGGAGGGGAGYGTPGQTPLRPSGHAGGGGLNTGGHGGSGFSTDQDVSVLGGSGGVGGGLGAYGASGNTGIYEGTRSAGIRYPGGPGGYCLRGASYVTWGVTGTRLGAII